MPYHWHSEYLKKKLIFYVAMKDMHIVSLKKGKKRRKEKINTLCFALKILSLKNCRLLQVGSMFILKDFKIFCST